jgi:hypothetical protein
LRSVPLIKEAITMEKETGKFIDMNFFSDIEDRFYTGKRISIVFI